MTEYIIDTHAHYDDKRFNEDRERLIESLKDNNIGAVINIGCDRKTSENSIKLANKYNSFYATVGIHPSEVKDSTPEDFRYIKEHCRDNKVVAIGEIGLDYHWDKEEKIRELQKRWFLMQLDLAKEAKLPVVIHSRDAANPTMEIMKSYDNDRKGIIHCYSYAINQAEEYVEMGYMLGIGGVVTYDDAKKLHRVVSEIPLEHIVLETDSPYLTPVPNRGKRNSSIELKYVVKRIAELKGITEEDVIKQTYYNAKKVYNI